MNTVKPFNQSYNPNPHNTGAVSFLALVAVIAAAGAAYISVTALYALSPAACAFAVVSAFVCFWLFIDVLMKPDARKRIIALVLLLLAAGVSLLSGIIALQWKWAGFAAIEWINFALYSSAIVFGAIRELNIFLRLCAMIFGAALMAAAIIAPTPGGDEGPGNSNQDWDISVTAVDQADNKPLTGAAVFCATVMRWQNTFKFDQAQAKFTDENGAAEWSFHEDPRLKIAFCTIGKKADDANAGYAPVTETVPKLFPGGKYEMKFALTENPYPDKAFLIVHPQTEGLETYKFSLELWDGPPPPEMVFGQNAPNMIARKTEGELQRTGGFAVPADRAGHDLYLLYRYEGADRTAEFKCPGTNYWIEETAQVFVGQVTAGGRRVFEFEPQRNC
jgi:hypothetical protein